MSQKQQPSSKEDVQQKKTEKDIIRARDQLAKQHKPSKNELITSDDQNKKNLPTREGGGPNSPPVKERHVPDFVSQSKINNTSFNNNSIVAKPGSFSKKTSVDGVPEPPQVVAAASLQQQQQNASTTMKITNKLKAARESQADSSSNKKSEEKNNNNNNNTSAVSPDPIPRGEGPPLPLAEKEKERERKERKQKAREEKERERRHMSPDDDEDDDNNDAKSEPRSHRSSQHHHHHHSQKDKKDKKDKKEHKKEKHGDRENGDSEQQKNSNDNNNTDKDKKRKSDKKYYHSTDGEGDRQHSASSDRQPSVQDVVNHFNNLTVEQQQQLLLLQQQREREKMQHPSQRNNNNSSEGETYQNNNNTTSSENEAVKNSSFVQNNNNQVSGRASGNPSPALSNNVPNNSFASVPNTSFAINNNNNMNNGSFGINNNNNNNNVNASFATQQPIVPNNSFVVGSNNNNNNNLMFGNSNLNGIENIFPPGSKDERKTKLLMAQLRSIQAELEATLYESTSSGPEEYNSASEQEQKQLQQNIRNEEQQHQQQMNLYGIFHPNFKRETSKMERQVMDQIEIDLQQRLKNARSLSGGEYSRDSDNSRSQSALFHPPAAAFVNHADNSNNGNFTGKVDTIEGSHSYHYHYQQSKAKDKELWQAASSTKEQRDSRSSSQLAQYPEFATSSSLRPPPVTYDRFGVTIKNSDNDNNQSSVVSTLSPRGSKYMSGAAQHENQATQDIVDSWRTRPVGLSRRQQILQSEKVHLTTVLADIQRSFDVDHFAGKTSLRKDPNEASPLRDREVKQAILMRSSHLLAAQRTLGTAVRDRELRHRLLLEAIRDLPSSNEGGVAGDSSTNIASLLSLHLSS